MKQKLYIISILVAVLSYSAAFAAGEAPYVRTAINKRSVLIGDRIRYAIEVSIRAPIDIEFPKFQDNMIGDFEIKDSGKAYGEGIFGKRTLSNWYEIAAYSPGKHIIPAFDIRYKGKGQGQWQPAKTAELAVIVESVLPKDKKVTDIRDIKRPFYFFSPMPWIIALIIAAALFFIIKRIYDQLKRRPPLSPYESAMHELEQLRSLFLSDYDLKEYYVRISDCVRRYVESVFNLRAPEMTTEEFFESAKDSPALLMNHKELLKKFLEACDLVKFAKYVPAQSEAEGVFGAAKNFIDETKDFLNKKEEGNK